MRRQWRSTIQESVLEHPLGPEDTSVISITEVAWKYNHRKDDNAFGSFMRECFA